MTRRARPARVVVVGSANLDLVYRVASLPVPGETVLASGSSRHPGGKGNNQAVAASRAGAPTSFVAAIGDDAVGDELVSVLREAGVELHLRRPSSPTGSALITVDDRAENTIVVDSGANAELVDLDDDERAVIAGAGVVLLQLESPLATVEIAARTARRAGALVVLNAAPFRSLPGGLLASIDVLVVNEGEAEAFGVERRFDGAVVVTLGARGAQVREPGVEPVDVPAAPVSPVDTTGAGDAFCGALAAGLVEGRSLVDAARFATVAAGLSVQRVGAVTSIPHRDEIDAALPPP